MFSSPCQSDGRDNWKEIYYSLIFLRNFIHEPGCFPGFRGVKPKDKYQVLTKRSNYRKLGRKLVSEPDTCKESQDDNPKGFRDAEDLLLGFGFRSV